jgi:RNA polymerase sigma-70 factor (ECF subfamily)
MDDAEITRWMLAARAGDREAAGAFIAATATRLRRLLWHLADPEHVEDLMQETYLRAFAALPRYAARAPAQAWLFAIARRAAADHVRQARRRPRHVGGGWQEEIDTRAPAAGPAELVAVEQAIAALDPQRREALMLTRVLGLSYEEAADACGCPVGTIRSRVHRARLDLMAALGEAA